jgi:hypothetical protein
MTQQRLAWRRLPAAWLVGCVVAASMFLHGIGPVAGPPDRKPVRSADAGFDAPDQALEWILLAYRDENGNIPRDGFRRARDQAEAMRRADRERAEEAARSGDPAAAGIARGAWTWIGPSNIGGRVRALAIHPTHPSTLITGGVAGGIWKSGDGGASWRLIDDFMGNLAVSTLVFRPGEPSVVLAGTGEGFFNQDAIRGAGVFISSNEGENWSQLPSTATADFDFVNRLAFSADGSTLIAATRTGLFRSVDLGASWAQALAQTSMLDVKFVPGSNTAVVAAGRNRNAFYSTNGGITWTASGGLSGGAATQRVELGVSRAAPNIVYASLDETNGQIWKSFDTGASYTKVSDSAHLATQGWYDNAIWVDPTDPNLVVAGGVSTYRSTNGGLNFSSIPNCHVDQHIILSDPGYDGGSNRRVYFGSDGGVCKMEDVTVNSVTSLRNGLGITQFYGGGGSAGRLLGGTQDNGTLLHNLSSGSNAWTTQHGSDGGFAAVDPVDPNNLYGEIQNFRLHRSQTGGPPSQYIYGGTGGQSCTKAVPFQVTDACSGNANFIAPFLLDPNEPNRLLAGGRSLWRSNDARSPNSATTGPIWTEIKSPSSNSNISAIAVAQGNADIIWVGHNNGDVYVALNGTAGSPTWLKVDTVLPNRTVTSIAIDPADPRIAYVAFGGFSPDCLWRTLNAGVTWLEITGSGGAGLPDAPVRSIAIHPFLPNWLYAATDVGVFASEDGGETWQLPHDGPSNVAVFQLFWMDATLVAVTHGRGMYTFATASDRPAFARRPLSQAVLPGQSVMFNVAAVGVPPLTFQWYRGPSGGRRDYRRHIDTPTPPVSTTTSYWVRVRNGLGSADSNTATLSVLPWATLYPGVRVQGKSFALIGSQPSDQTVRAGGTATFVVISLWPAARYQWQVSADGRSWKNVGDSGTHRGARTPALMVSPAGRGHDRWRYRCVVTAGSLTQVSTSAILSVRR